MDEVEAATVDILRQNGLRFSTFYFLLLESVSRKTESGRERDRACHLSQTMTLMTTTFDGDDVAINNRKLGVKLQLQKDSTTHM